MTDLLPIPADSLVARDILRMEQVLVALRTTAAGAGALDKFSAHDYSRGGGVKFANLLVTGEGQYDWQAFYHYHGVEWRGRHRATEQRPAGTRGPQWVRFCTEDRKLWAHLLPAMLESLRGMRVHVTRDASWRWDRTNPRPNGSPRYIPVYQAMVSLDSESSAGFDPESVLPSFLDNCCLADNPLADQHLFDWQQDSLGKLLFSSYAWNPNGVTAVFAKKADLVEAANVLFAGYDTVIERKPARLRRWALKVDLRTRQPRPEPPHALDEEVDSQDAASAPSVQARVTAHRGILVVELLAKKSIKGVVTSNIDTPNNLGTVIHNTGTNLGVSAEALALLKTIRKGHDAIGDVDWFRSNDGHDNFAWLGGPKRLMDPATAQAARGYAMLGHKVIPNTASVQAKAAVDQLLASAERPH